MPETLDHCPLCLHDRFDSFINISGRDDDDPFSGGSYYICPECSCAFLNPRMTEKELNEYYVSGEYREITAKDDPDGTLGDKQTKERAEYIAEMVKNVKAERHLDVGCYKGDLIREVIERIPKIVSFGVDPDPNMQNDNIFGKLEDVKDKFDLITCIQTLEHVLNPVPFMRRIYERLTPGGVLMVEVPNRRANMMAFIPPHHVIAYDEKSLKKAMDGFDIVRTIFHGFPFMSPLDLSLLVIATRSADV